MRNLKEQNSRWKNGLTSTPSLPGKPILRRLIWAGWIVIALISVMLFFANVIANFYEMATPCEGALGFVEGCNSNAISSAEVNILTSRGITLRDYAVGMSIAPLLNLLLYCTLAGLILWRKGNSWLGLTVSLALVTLPFAMYAGSRDWATIAPFLFWPGVIAAITGTVIIIVFLYLMPNGRFSPRWAYIPMVIVLLLVTILALEINGIITVAQDKLSYLYFPIITLVILSGVFQVYRYRWDSNITERQQTKWIIFAVGAYFSSIIVWVIVFGGGVTIPSGEARLQANLIATLYIDFFALPFLPIAITIAILRYNLWGIDGIFRKTLIYAVLTLLLTLIYFGMIVLLQSLFDSVSGQQSQFAIVISTLVIAALFSPLRSRVQTVIDRSFFRSNYETQQVLAHFAQTARDETNMEALQAELVRVAQETMQPEQVGVWLNNKQS